MDFVGSNLACVRGNLEIFSGLSFSLELGEVLMLTGSNGSGKTSLLRLMAGLSRPTQGVILWQGRSISADPEEHFGQMTYVGHSDALKPYLTAFENLALWTAIRRPAFTKDQLVKALNTFGLKSVMGKPAGYLSAGQRRRAALARLVSVDATLWLLDEPTIGLDDHACSYLFDAIHNHRKNGGMTVIATNVALPIRETQTLDLGAYISGITQ
jgi:heme exporter protein A